MDNVNRFLDAFSIIEQQCREIADEDRYAKFYILLEKASKINRIVKYYSQDIQEYADLRNAIIHQRTKSGSVIAVPVDEAVEEIEKIAQMLSHPPRLKDYFLKEVRGCSASDKIEEVYTSMKALSTSKYPIFTNGRFDGLLTIEMIADWAVNNKQSLPNPTVMEVFKPHKNEKVYFIEKNAPVLEALAMFEESMRKGMNLLAILITENGRREERVLGILTVADLPKLYKLAEK